MRISDWSSDVCSSDLELVALWRASYKLDGPRGALVRLLMITLQRRSEVASLPWAELDQDKRLWLLPGERSKNGEEHLLPLSDLAMDEFKAVGRQKRGLVLPCSTGKTPVSNLDRKRTRLNSSH